MISGTDQSPLVSVALMPFCTDHTDEQFAWVRLAVPCVKHHPVRVGCVFGVCVSRTGGALCTGQHTGTLGSAQLQML